MTEETGFLTLKWGTLKEWELTSKRGKELQEEYDKIGSSFSAIHQKDTPRQKEIICEMIDLVPGEIYLEWDGKYVTKEAAKTYVMNYDHD